MEFPLHLAAFSSALGSLEVSALEEEAAAAALACRPRFGARGPGEEVPPPPPLPPSRCPRAGLGRAAMPSDFISLLSADLDLESPKSLYSRESVYDLLPKELQLPPSRETSVASMSQTSGGEAGSPPPAVVAAGMHFILLFKEN